MSSAFGKWFRMPPLGERLRRQGVREDVVGAAERTAYGRQTDRALPALAAALTEDEVLLQLVEGRLRGEYGLFGLTSRRLVFLPSADSRALTLDAPLADIGAVSWRMHRGLGIVEVGSAAPSPQGIATAGSTAVDKILGNQAESIATRIQQELDPTSHRPLPVDRDPLDVLAELRALHTAGVISDSEFQIRKRELFGQI